MDGMEERMSQVRVKIRAIAEKNEEVDGKMESKRARFDELTTVRAAMAKLNEVFELPAKCRLSIERGALEVATKYVVCSRGFLDKHEAQVPQVKKDMEECGADLVRALRGREAKGGEEGAMAADLLRQLGEAPAEKKEKETEEEEVVKEEEELV